MAFEYERDEWRSAVAQLTEIQRAESCGHTVRVNGICYDCGDSEEDHQHEELDQ